MSCFNLIRQNIKLCKVESSLIITVVENIKTVTLALETPYINITTINVKKKIS